MSTSEESMQKLGLFSDAPAIKEALLKYGYSKTFEEGGIIVTEDAYIRAIPIVLSGNIKVMQSNEDGDELLLYFIGPGESCIMSFLGGIHQEKSRIRAIAEETAEILFIPVDKVMQFIKDYPQWVDYIFRLYHKRFEELLQVVNAVAFTKIDERLLLLLQKKAAFMKTKTIAITHEQLAGELGTARVVVSRLLKQLENAGRVNLGRNRISLV